MAHHVHFRENSWVVQHAREKTHYTFSNQEEATLLATCLAATSNTEVIVHDHFGAVEHRFSPNKWAKV